MIVFAECHLHHLLRSYLDYYNETRTHLSLDKDAPIRASKRLVVYSTARYLVDCIIICTDLICDRHTRNVDRQDLLVFRGNHKPDHIARQRFTLYSVI